MAEQKYPWIGDYVPILLDHIEELEREIARREPPPAKASRRIR